MSSGEVDAPLTIVCVDNSAQAEYACTSFHGYFPIVFMNENLAGDWINPDGEHSLLCKIAERFLDNIYQKPMKIMIAHCISQPIIFGETSASAYATLIEESQEHGADVKKRYAGLLKKRGLKGTFISSLEASPEEWLVEVARTEKANLVVAGTRGQNFVRRTILGSVSDYLLHELSCTVCVCPMDHDFKPTDKDSSKQTTPKTSAKKEGTPKSTKKEGSSKPRRKDSPPKTGEGDDATKVESKKRSSSSPKKESSSSSKKESSSKSDEKPEVVIVPPEVQPES